MLHYSVYTGQKPESFMSSECLRYCRNSFYHHLHQLQYDNLCTPQLNKKAFNEEQNWYIST